MPSISNNGMIVIKRGDELSVPLFINQGTKLSPVRFDIKSNPTVVIYFGVMGQLQPFNKSVIRKKYTVDSDINEYGDLIVTLDAKDTQCLHTGKYFYQFVLDFNNDEGAIIITPATEFFIVE